MNETVDFMGERFRVADRVGLMPLMRFATLAKSGVDANELDGLAALHELLEQCIHPEDWDKFQRHASASRADGDDLNAVVGEAMAIVAGRPTVRPSVSPDGPQTIEPISTVDSSSPVIDMFNGKGRPDLALLVRKRQESLPA